MCKVDRNIKTIMVAVKFLIFEWVFMFLTTYRSVRIHIVVRLTRVYFTEQESSLRAALLGVNVTRSWKSSGQNFSCVVDRSSQQLTEVFIFRQILIFELPPLSYRLEKMTNSIINKMQHRGETFSSRKKILSKIYLAMKDENLEESIHE